MILLIDESSLRSVLTITNLGSVFDSHLLLSVYRVTAMS
ncbi:unnamed protein product [Brassica oleracea]